MRASGGSGPGVGCARVGLYAPPALGIIAAYVFPLLVRLKREDALHREESIDDRTFVEVG